MAAAEPLVKESSPIALPGLARALISAGKLPAKTAEDIYQKSLSGRTSFIAELTGTGAVSAADLAHTLSSAFGAPLLDLDAIDPQRLPKDLLDPKLCQAYRVVVLSKRNNRLIVATADPSDQQAAEKIKFASQMGVDWVIAEYDKLSRMIEAAAVSASETIDSIIGAEFEFDESRAETSTDSNDQAVAEVEDAPVVRFLHKMLLDAFSMRASDIHFEPYEHNYRVRFRVDGELREIAIAADRHQGQAGLAHQGHLAAGHLREARAAGRPHEAQDRSRPRDRFPGQHPAHAVRREDRDPYPRPEQRTPGHRCAGLRRRRKRAPARRHRPPLRHGAGHRARPAPARPCRSTPA